MANELVNNKLTRFKGLDMATVDKKKVVMDCPSTEEALDVTALLMKSLIPKLQDNSGNSQSCFLLST